LSQAKGVEEADIIFAARSRVNGPASLGHDVVLPHIVGIGGTTRPHSVSERALRIALDAAASKGASTSLLGARDLHLPMYDPDQAERTPDARRLVSELARADGLIISSPGYHGGLSGLIKNALDYAEDLSHADVPYLEGRAVGCIACAAGWQATTTTLISLRSVVHALRGWPTPLGAIVNSAHGLASQPAALDTDSTLQQLETVGCQVVEFARVRRYVTHI
jgi:FMN reductase